MALHPRELEAMLRARMDPEATIHDMTDNGGWGLVRWSRPRDYILGGREHITHRWATKDTDGVERWPGGHFYSGGYWDEEEFARADYVKRIDRGPERNQPPLARLADEGKV